MNANQIINMIIRQVMRRVMNKGINAGMDAVGKKMSKGKQGQPQQTAQVDTGESQKRMRQTMKVTKRMGRF
ncbi:MAG: hypothetical protein AB8B82_00935 [Roseovarius sp.]